jgi:hypothetical protein
MHRILELGVERGPEFIRAEHRPQHRGDVAVAALPLDAHPLDEGGRGLVGDEEHGELARDEARGRRMAREAVERLVELALAASADRLAEQRLRAGVVPGGC